MGVGSQRHPYVISPDVQPLAEMGERQNEEETRYWVKYIYGCSCLGFTLTLILSRQGRGKVGGAILSRGKMRELE